MGGFSFMCIMENIFKNHKLMKELETCRNEDEIIELLQNKGLWKNIIGHSELELLKSAYAKSFDVGKGFLSLNILDKVSGGMFPTGIHTSHRKKRPAFPNSTRKISHHANYTETPVDKTEDAMFTEAQPETKSEVKTKDKTEDALSIEPQPGTEEKTEDAMFTEIRHENKSEVKTEDKTENALSMEPQPGTEEKTEDARFSERNETESELYTGTGTRLFFFDKGNRHFVRIDHFPTVAKEASDYSDTTVKNPSELKVTSCLPSENKTDTETPIESESRLMHECETIITRCPNIPNFIDDLTKCFFHSPEAIKDNLSQKIFQSIRPDISEASQQEIIESLYKYIAITVTPNILEFPKSHFESLERSLSEKDPPLHSKLCRTQPYILEEMPELQSAKIDPLLLDKCVKNPEHIYTLKNFYADMQPFPRLKQFVEKNEAKISELLDSKSDYTPEKIVSKIANIIYHSYPDIVKIFNSMIKSDVKEQFKNETIVLWKCVIPFYAEQEKLSPLIIPTIKIGYDCKYIAVSDGKYFSMLNLDYQEFKKIDANLNIFTCSMLALCGAFDPLTCKQAFLQWPKATRYLWQLFSSSPL